MNKLLIASLLAVSTSATAATTATIIECGGPLGDYVTGGRWVVEINEDKGLARVYQPSKPLSVLDGRASPTNINVETTSAKGNTVQFLIDRFTLNMKQVLWEIGDTKKLDEKEFSCRIAQERKI